MGSSKCLTEIKPSGLLQGGHPALEAHGIIEPLGLKLPRGLIGTHAGVADENQALVPGDFAKPVLQGFLGDVEPAFAEMGHKRRGIGSAPDI